ncbi:MAG TPA: dihydroxyacetone kinase subunit DhaL [Nitrolancea sp.]|nr:dihydroxyacetone kinase subunit DhaL [Nitrolancea sp.]
MAQRDTAASDGLLGQVPQPVLGRRESIGLGTLARVQAAIRENADELSRLDAAIGDGDHGYNLARAFHEAMVAVERLPEETPVAALTATGEALRAIACLASGLYAAGCLAAARALPAERPPSTRDLAAAFEAGVAAIQAEGHAVPGNKTMVDALRPAADALLAAVAGEATLALALDRAAAAARAGMAATTAQPGVFGRAGKLGNAAIGHLDPGATSAYLIVQALAHAAHALP